MELSMKYLLMAMVLIALTLDEAEAAKKSKRGAAEYKQRIRPAGDSASQQMVSSRRYQEFVDEQGAVPVQRRPRNTGKVREDEEPRKAKGHKYNESYKKQRNVGNSKEGNKGRIPITVEALNKQKWKGGAKLRKDKFIDQKEIIEDDSMDYNHRAVMCTDDEEYEEGDKLEDMIEEEPEDNFNHGCSNTYDRKKAKQNCASKNAQQGLVQEDSEGKCYYDV